MQNIILIGSGKAGKGAYQLMKEKYGDDIVLVSPEEAKEKGITEFANMPSFPIKPMHVPIVELMPTIAKSGRQKRVERRKQERKSKKRK